ncbi:MAG: 16S rRNA (guanine(966)-N(2))-methyltransferase RsmD [Clostridia bacterium]|nr:16S rRNA (guanine(966)-N(2))-methyltransferase RsmD [Clostridia bacterium]
MRIISGKYRGKKLKEFDLNTTKPTLDRVKESIFNLIQFDVDGAVVCDLFSGTGAFGLECVSRGAKQVYLVDSNTEAIKLIKSNSAGMEGNFEIVNKDYLEFLKVCPKCDLFLLDPPYKTDFGSTAIDYIIKNDLLNDNGKIVFETGKDLNFVFDYPNFEIDRRNYGTVTVYKLTKK